MKYRDVFSRNNTLEKVDISDWAGNSKDRGLSTTLRKLLRGLDLMTPSNWNGTWQSRLYTGELPRENVFQLASWGIRSKICMVLRQYVASALTTAPIAYQKTVAMGQTNPAKSNFFPMALNMSISIFYDSTPSSLGRPVFISSRSLTSVI